MTSTATGTPDPTQSPVRFWATRGAYGVLLCAAVVALEFAYYYPLVSVRNQLGLDSVASSLMTWGGECLLVALAVGILEYRTSPREPSLWALALTVAVGAFGGALIWNLFTEFVLRDQFGVKLFVDHVSEPVAWVKRVFYHGWLLFFFGGLAAATLASLRQCARMLAALRAAELAHATSQQRLAEVTLSNLEARIDPQFVIQTLSKLEVLYDAHPLEADRLLQELIDFLRSALADIHSSNASITLDQMPDRREALTVA